LSETTFAWQDTSLSPRERGERLVEVMTLEQKIAKLHGAMETIDIYAITKEAAESGADMDQLAAQIRVERHVRAIEELGIPRSGSRTARSVSAWATVLRRTLTHSHLPGSPSLTRSWPRSGNSQVQSCDWQPCHMTDI
jgi:hypothetical protein